MDRNKGRKCTSEKRNSQRRRRERSARISKDVISSLEEAKTGRGSADETIGKGKGQGNGGKGEHGSKGGRMAKEGRQNARMMKGVDQEEEEEEHEEQCDGWVHC